MTKSNIGNKQIYKISTHTLTWSVTAGGHFSWWFGKFQLTRSRGAWRGELFPSYILGVFQLTRSRGAWPNRLVLSPTFWNFNSHAHVERDGTLMFIVTITNDFNSHAHVERDWYVQIIYLNAFNFNSHAHVERDLKFYNDKTTLKDFNSHAHVERDQCCQSFGNV